MLKKIIYIGLILITMLVIVIVNLHSTSGYFGLICASDFGQSVPVISVQTVPLLWYSQLLEGRI
jgi:hypothetical protein